MKNKKLILGFIIGFLFGATMTVCAGNFVTLFDYKNVPFGTSTNPIYIEVQ